jgi:hypothetical protein
MRREILSQLKNIRVYEITSAIRRDNRIEREGEGSSFVYKKEARMVVINKHPLKHITQVSFPFYLKISVGGRRI